MLQIVRFGDRRSFRAAEKVILESSLAERTGLGSRLSPVVPPAPAWSPARCRTAEWFRAYDTEGRGSPRRPFRPGNDRLPSPASNLVPTNIKRPRVPSFDAPARSGEPRRSRLCRAQVRLSAPAAEVFRNESE